MVPRWQPASVAPLLEYLAMQLKARLEGPTPVYGLAKVHYVS
jgi:hypothetical protein